MKPNKYNNMKSTILLILAGVLIIACGKNSKVPDNTTTVKDEPPTREQMQKNINEKEKADPTLGSMKKGRGGNPNRTTAGLVNGGLTPITGEGSVGHGDTYDSIRATISHWGFKRFVVPTVEAIWWSVWFSHQDANAPYPGRTAGLDMINWYETFPNPPASHVYEVLWPHQGLAVTYFIGVSSDGGWNYAGKTIPNN